MERWSPFRGATRAKPPDYVETPQTTVTQNSFPATQSSHTVWIVKVVPPKTTVRSVRDSGIMRRWTAVP